jgi:hypothetical protein
MDAVCLLEYKATPTQVVKTDVDSERPVASAQEVTFDELMRNVKTNDKP